MTDVHQINGYRSSDGTSQPLRLDKATNTLQTMSYEHHEIHGGSAFTVSYNEDVGNGANCDVLLVTPNTTKWAHLTYSVDVEVEAMLYIYEAPTATPGSALVAYNRDRNSATTATVTVSSTPTSITPGTTIIRQYHFGSGRTFGGGDRAVFEFILKQNTKYLLRVNNMTANANYISLKLDWYEHVNLV